MPITKPVAFATAAENIAGTAENKALDPLGIREALNCTGDAPVYACRAWVNFNGTGAVAIRASGNVSSITDNGTGNYTVNFATAMSDANYAAHGQTENVESNSVAVQNYTQNGVGFLVWDGVSRDPVIASVAIFR